MGLVSLTCEESRAAGRRRSKWRASSPPARRPRCAGPSTRSTTGCAWPGPAFDASLALEVLGFTGPEAKEGIASHREKRKPNFPPEPKDF